jgi:hypothetical protein
LIPWCSNLCSNKSLLKTSIKEATIYTFGLIVGPSFGLAAEAQRRFEVVHDGGTLVRLLGCCSAGSVTKAVEWLGTAGVAVHRVVELPTDPASPARAIADEVNHALGTGR